MAQPPIPGLDHTTIETLIRRFYGAARVDPLLAEPFSHVRDWEHHIARICRFWHAVALKEPGYSGHPMQAHLPLAIAEPHFARWLELFRAIADDVCPDAADELLVRATTIARSLRMGIAVHQGQLPPRA